MSMIIRHSLLAASFALFLGAEDIVEKQISLHFEEITVPFGQKQEKIQTTKKVSLDGESQDIAFSLLMKTGDSDNNETYGLLKDYNDNAIKLKDGSPYICNGTNGGVGSGLDHTSILHKNNHIYMISQFECSIGAFYMLELEQNSSDGTLEKKKDTLRYISQKSEFGGYEHCAGMTTPWESHLSSEESEPDAKAIERGAKDKNFDETLLFWNGERDLTNPYYYGWTPEVQIDAQGEPLYLKHFSMGRFSHEVAYVMPDQKSVYMSDDGTNSGLFLFIADKQQDLSSGRLFAAKFIQLSQEKGGQFGLEWIDLGHATNAEIRSFVAQKPNFSDIFDSEEFSLQNGCSKDFVAVNTSFGPECLKLKKGMEKIASRLETRRYAALKGATTELRKQEGIAYNPEENRLYIASTIISEGMEDNKKFDQNNDSFDRGGHNHVRLPYNKCGAIYSLDLDSSAYGSSYIASNFNSILVGVPKEYKSGQYKGNNCDVESISSPDNIEYIPKSGNLIIGEDSDYHINNVVWVYNLKSDKLTRIMSMPLGAEATSTHWERINNYSYLTVVVQHPQTEDKESFVGYLGPIKMSSK